MHPNVKFILDTKATLAPMLGTTDAPFRVVCREYGLGHGYTEMASAKGIAEGSSEAYRYAVFDADEGPVSIQLVAATPDGVSLAVQRLAPLHPAFFDINCGCPDDRICEAGAGADLLEDLARLGRVIDAAVRASDVPVSVKVRMSAHRKENTIRRIVRTAEDNGAALIAVHGRARSASYSEAAHWESIAVAKDEARVPVLGNGDVFSARDAHAMMQHTGCDAVMVARGALGTPWIFRDIAEGSERGILDAAPSADAMRPGVLRHLAAIEKLYGPVLALPRARKHLLWYARRFAGFETLRHEVFLREDCGYLRETADRFFSSNPEPLGENDPVFLAIEETFRRRVLFWMTQ
ncbi:MAG: tRNA-dihydrouridine synthase [Ignavibacteriae bacterium]|nr:tRNA-dihydrouridine synthase [Ignavibacteriota bacterium]